MIDDPNKPSLSVPLAAIPGYQPQKALCRSPPNVLPLCFAVTAPAPTFRFVNLTRISAILEQQLRAYLGTELQKPRTLDEPCYALYTSAAIFVDITLLLLTDQHGCLHVLQTRNPIHEFGGRPQGVVVVWQSQHKVVRLSNQSSPFSRRDWT